MWGKKPEDRIRARACKRMRVLDTSDVINWADQCGTVVASHLNEYRQHRDPLSLQEAQSALSSLAGVVDALESRAQVS